ncbi:hypothetical protein Skr01_04580 [Sphaerisporangium krabiense]|uniref:Outer membrane channel protein CpnT-like N-terminal domain-containing protein n=1 Tax=Sphaerisporangium krabiense TaxID=763782 RepID=A0A7W8Z7P3_9ACTN|nr:hypothetical protein [Sphaerisporangium krabiense]MBB5628785.1 hypothetical protein [Sphaerisporangium krabiense]GII60373.1 hypothetical protein Skr01_04580 [Sphaerisporangium krabiense]
MTIDVNPNTSPGGSTGGGGSSTTDITPAWGESLPGWVDTLIALIVSGQSWPEASERLLWELAKEHQALGESLYGAVEPGVTAVRTVLSGWDVPATPGFVTEADRLFAERTGVAGLGVENLTKALQADNFARETQYSKISINVAFWVAVTAAFIALVSAFFTAGASTPMIGPIAASARAAIGRILQRLAAVAGRDFGSAMVTRLAATRAAQAGGAGLFRTALSGHLAREIIEEVGEEVFIDAWTQREQMKLGTRDGWDWKKTAASAVGGAGGAVIGMKAAGPMSRLGDRIPLLRALNNAGAGPGVGNAFARFPGRAIQTGLNNMAASPGGSILANGLVYGQWELPDAESLLGAAVGGAGRTNTISPFNPDVFTAVTHPYTSLAAANAAAAATDAQRAFPTSTDTSQPQNPPQPTRSATTGAPGQSSIPPDLTAAVNPPGLAAPANPQALGTSQNPSGAGPSTSTSGGNTSGGNATGPTGSQNPVSTTSPDTSHPGVPQRTTEPGGPGIAAPHTSGNGTIPSVSENPSGPPVSHGSNPTGSQPSGPTGSAPATPQTSDPAGSQGTNPTGTTDTGTTGTGRRGPEPGGMDATSTSSTPAATNPPDGPANNAPPAANTTATPPTSPTPQPATPPTPAGPATPTGPAIPVTSALPATSATSPASAPATTSASSETTSESSETSETEEAAETEAPKTSATPGTSEAAQTSGASVPGPAANAGSSQIAAPVEERARAGEALARAVRVTTPDALPLQDGGLRLTAHDGTTVHVSRDSLAAIHDHVTVRAGDGASSARLEAEAAALLGMEAARLARRSPIEGALDTLARIPDGSPDTHAVILAVTREVVTDNPAGWPPDRLSPAAGRLVAAAVAEPDGTLAAPSPSPLTSEAARAIVREAEDLPLTLRLGDPASPEGTSGRSPSPISSSASPSPSTSPSTRSAEVVPARPIRRTAFVADGRPAGVADLGVEEARTAAADLRATDFGRGVRDVEWPPGSGALRVETEDHGVQHFIVGERNVPRGRLARTQVRAGTAEEPHVVSFALRVAADQVPRVWVHEISHTMRRLAARDAGADRQGIVRRYLSGMNPAGPVRASRDECVAARYDEHRWLARKWESAATEEERLARRTDIEGIARELAHRGHTPPIPPWSPSPLHPDPTSPAGSPVTPLASSQATGGRASGVADLGTPVPVASLAAQVRGLVGALAEAETALGEAKAAKTESAKEAADRATTAENKAAKAAGQRDQGAGERQRKSLADAEAEKDAAARYTDVAEAFRRAGERAAEARTAYERTLRALDDLAARTSAPGSPPSAATPAAETTATDPAERTARAVEEVVRAAREAEERLEAYRGAVRETVPPAIALSSGVPTGRLPHLGRLTEVINAEVGPDHRFTEDELNFLLRAEYRRVVSRDGLVVRRGPNEINIRLRPGDLVEVLDLPVKASELMAGTLPQGGASVAATFARAVGASGELDMATLAKLVGPDHGVWALVKAVAPFAILKGGYGRGRQASTTGSSAEYALAGAVEDNRGESSLFTAQARWDVRLRTGSPTPQIPPSGGATVSPPVETTATPSAETTATPSGETAALPAGDARPGAVRREVEGARPREGGPGWRDVATVASGIRGDAEVLRLWVAHAYTVHGPGTIDRLPPHERGKTPFPEHVVTGLTGLEALTDRVAAALGSGRAPIGGDTRDQLRVMLIDELPSRLGEAIDDPHDFQRVVTENGRPLANVRVHTEVVLEPAPATAAHPAQDGPRAVGTASAKHHLERLRVGFSGASGTESASRSTSVGASAGAKAKASLLLDATGADELLDAAGVDDSAAANWTPRLAGGFTRAASRSHGQSAGGMAIHPSVQRWTGHTQGYRIALRHTVTVRMLGDHAPLPPVHGASEGLFRIPEPDAYRYGLPVDAAAVVRAPDGSVRLRDDPSLAPPPGRLPVLPQWLGAGPGQARGAGPALVQRVTGIDAVRAQVEGRLRKIGVLPALDANGDPRPSRDRVAAAAQMRNLREVAEQFSAARLETGYDQATQDGILLDLVRHRTGQAPRHITLRIRLDQQMEAARYAGVTPAETVVNLDIGSDTSARSLGRSVTWSGRGELGAGHDAAGPGDSDWMFTGGGAGRQVAHGRSTGWSAGNTVNQVRLVETTVPAAIFEVPHTVQVERLLPNGGTTPFLDGDPDKREVSARILLASDLLPAVAPERTPPARKRKRGRTRTAPSARAGQARTVPAEGTEPKAHAEAAAAPAAEGWPTPEAVLARATFLHLDAGDMVAAVRSVLPRGTRPDSAALHHLAAFSNVRGLISHPWWTHTPYETELAVRPGGVRPVRSTLSIRGEPGTSRFVGAVDAVNGHINLTLGSSTTSAGRQRTVTWDASTGAGVNQAADPKGGLGPGGSASRTDGSSRADTAIWGRERLTIEVGKQYVFQMDVGFTVTGSERGTRDARTVTPEKPGGGTVVYMLPERDALLLYADGTLPLPLHQVSDAVERFVDDTLALDPVLAPLLIRRYLTDLHAARTAKEPLSPLAGRHEARLLLPKLTAMFGKDAVVQKGQKRHRLSRLLAHASTLERTRVALPEHFRRAMGQTSFESVTLLDGEGRKVELAAAVMDAVRAVSPKALDADPALRRAIMGQFGGQNWWGSVDNMIDNVIDDVTRDTAEDAWHSTEYTARIGAQRAEKIVVRVRARIDEGTPVLEGRSDEVGHIIQNYDYAQTETSRSTGRSFAGDAGGDAAVGDESGRGRLATHREHSSSGSTGEQLTHLQRVSSFDGADRVRHPIRITVEAERMPLSSGDARVLAARAGTLVRGPRVHRASDLHGEVVRLVPDGLTARADLVPAPSPTAPDPRPAARPDMFHVDATEAPTLLTEVADRLAARDMLGRAGMREHRTHLAHQLSAIARIASFTWMTGQDGHRMARLPVPGTRGEVVDVWVRAVLSEPHVVVGDRAQVEIGEVFRRQETATVATSRSRVTPLGGSAGGGHGPAGVGGGLSAGDQASERDSASGGNRNETSNFEKGTAVTTRWRVDYHVRLVRTTLEPGGGERPGRTVTLPSSIVGSAHLQLMRDQLADVYMRMESGSPAGAGWHVPGGAATSPSTVLPAATSPSTTSPAAALPAAPSPATTSPPADRARFWPWRRAAPVSTSLDDLLGDARGRPSFAADPGAAMAEALGGARGRPGTPVRLHTADAGASPGVEAVTHAQLLARALRAEVLLDVHETDRDVHRRYIASPDGALAGDRPDAGFASALATLPPALRTAARDAGLDLRALHATLDGPGTSEGGVRGAAGTGTFADAVRAALGTDDVPRPEKPFWPTKLWGPGPEAAMGSYLGGAGPVTAPPIPGTAFTADGRAADLSDVSPRELKAALTGVAGTDLPRGVGAPVLSPDGTTVSVTVPGRGEQHFGWEVGHVRGGRLARTTKGDGTPEKPHVIRFAPRVAPDQIPRVWVHELAEMTHRLATTPPEASGASTPESPSTETGTAQQPTSESPSTETPAAEAATWDACLVARYAEHRWLVRKLGSARTDAERAGWAHEIEGVDGEIAARGAVPPVPSSRSEEASVLPSPAPPGPAAGPPPPPGAAPSSSGDVSSPDGGRESDEEFWARMRRLSNSTGWIPPEEWRTGGPDDTGPEPGVSARGRAGETARDGADGAVHRGAEG